MLDACLESCAFTIGCLMNLFYSIKCLNNNNNKQNNNGTNSNNDMSSVLSTFRKYIEQFELRD